MDHPSGEDGNSRPAGNVQEWGFTIGGSTGEGDDEYEYYSDDDEFASKEKGGNTLATTSTNNNANTSSNSNTTPVIASIKNNKMPSLTKPSPLSASKPLKLPSI